jgi:glutathione S-transferase
VEFVDEVNPSALLPALTVRSASTGEVIATLTQSLAIIDFLENYRPNNSDHAAAPLLPLGTSDAASAFARAHVLEVVLNIACDIHPVQNLRVLQSYPEADRPARAKEVITQGFRSVEALIKKGYQGEPDLLTTVQFCCGHALSLADLVLVPQVYNARR